MVEIGGGGGGGNKSNSGSVFVSKALVISDKSIAGEASDGFEVVVYGVLGVVLFLFGVNTGLLGA